jgi:hypothetical protein
MTPYPGTPVHGMACTGEGLRFVKPEYASDWRVYRRWGQRDETTLMDPM